MLGVLIKVYYIFLLPLTLLPTMAGLNDSTAPSSSSTKRAPLQIQNVWTDEFLYEHRYHVLLDVT